MAVAVHLLQPPDPALVEVLRACLVPAVALSLGPDRPDPAEYHVLVAGRPQREDLTASAKLHTLIIPWSGLPEETRELLQAFPHLAVHNLHHNAAPVAELAVALLLAAAKFIVPLDRALRHHDWTPRYEPSRAMLLQGKTALILGYGAIGQRVGRLCRALGMDVLATRRNVTGVEDDPAHEVHPPQALPQLLPCAHALIVCLPLTPETEGLLGERELNLLPPEAVLVNVGRGKIVDQAALYQALSSGFLRAAGLDVWYNYPSDAGSRAHTPPADYPFHELDNVVMSPHRGGASDGTGRLRMEHLAQLLNAAARGETLPNRVDVARGY